jgi:hypothetical protein
MSQPLGFGLNGKSLYTNVCMPKEVWCNFIVDHANGNGLGIRSLKSNGYIRNVFMNTNQAPGTNNGATNPNPQAGYALIQFNNNFNYYLGGFSGQIIPPTGAALGSVTSGNVYILNAVGTTTLAQWQAVGLPKGLTPTPLQSFVATATQAIGGSGTVKVPGVPTTQVVTVVGDPNQEINNSNIAANGGAYVLVQFSAATAAGNTAMVAAAPADNVVVGMMFAFDGSSVTIDGI